MTSNFSSDSVKKKFGSGFEAFLDPDPNGNFCPDPDSMNMDPKHCLQGRHTVFSVLV